MLENPGTERLTLPLMPATAALIAARNAELSSTREAAAMAEQRLADVLAVLFAERGLDAGTTEALELTKEHPQSLVVRITKPAPRPDTPGDVPQEG